eukprot:5310243-Amphidinium_carterae.1
MSCPLMPDELMQAWLPSKQFHLRAAYNFKQVCHVNRQELLAWRTGLKALLRRDGVRRARVSVLIDSAVVVNVLKKGRSSSRQLNSLLRSSLLYLELGSLTCHPLWVQSKHNPADDPTRFAPLRQSTPVPELVHQEVLRVARRHPWVWEACRLMWEAEGTLDEKDRQDLLEWIPEDDKLAESDAARRLTMDFDSSLGFP